MKIINVDINDEIIFKNVLDVDTGVITGISSGIKLPTGNYNNIILNFSFANQKLCENFNIFASFKINNGTPIVQELEPMTIGNVTYERACNIPNEVFKDKCEVTLGVYGYRLNEDETLDKRFSLVPVRNFVIEGSYDPDSTESIVPTPTVFEIYFDKINKAEEDCQAMLEQTAIEVDNKLNAIQTDYDTFKAEKDAEVNDFLNNAEGQFMGTVNQLEAEFEETQTLVGELETAVDEMEVKVDDMQTTVEKMPGDLYTQDRYNIPDVTYELMAENISIEENIFPSEWSEVTAETSYIAEDGTKLTSSGCRSSSYLPTKAFDGSTNSSWGQIITGSEGWLKIEFPTPQKITHMKIHTYANGTGTFTMKIQGSNDDSTWTDLYSRSSVCSSLSEIKLSTSLVDFYKFYRMYWKPNDTNSFTTGVYEWQVSKYIGDFYSYVNSIDFPLTSYEKNKIVNIEGNRFFEPKDLETVTENLFPASSDFTSNSETKYTSSEGFVLISSGGQNLLNSIDDNVSSDWQDSTSNLATQWIRMEVPNPNGYKVTKMKLKAGWSGQSSQKIAIEGSFDGNTWIDLFAWTGLGISVDEDNIELNNTDFYKYYRVSVVLNTGATQAKAVIYDWKVREYLKVLSVEEQYITSFENPYLNINNLGEKQINGTINYGQKYSLVYNGESWDIAGAKVVTGRVSATSDLQTINLGFTPDLVICYVGANNKKQIASASSNQATQDAVPRILTKAYSHSNGAIVENGFTLSANSSHAIYYMAIKF